uniref:Uncharacterized protein n=1 Tax=Arundo donax TaxID=35708 RepID=A0A0A9HJW9_ARUDO
MTMVLRSLLVTTYALSYYGVFGCRNKGG